MSRFASLLLGIGAVLTLVLGLVLPASASAAPLVAPVPHAIAGSGTAGVANTCHVTPKSGVSAVFVHTQPNTGSNRIGQINHGQSAVAACTATHGGTYTACGGTSFWWVGGVRWNGAVGFVALQCVNWTIS